METEVSSFVDTPRLRFHYKDFGGSGTPLVLLHGLASSLHIWDLVASRLTARARVIALDQRGHGLTDQPSEGYEIDDSANDLLAFVEALDIDKPFFIAGHSWGASVALEFATRYAAWVKGVVLVDGGVIAMQSVLPTWEIAEAQLTPPAMNGVTETSMREIIRTRWLSRAWSPEVEKAAMHNFRFRGDGTLERCLRLENHMQIARSLWAFDPTERLRQLEKSVLFVVAMDERAEIKRRRASEIEREFANCKVELFEDTIHDIPWHRPEQLAIVLSSFIQAHSRH